MKRSDFPSDFAWGAATAAYQIEGSASADGRGPCIWDTFSHLPGKTRDGDTGDVACDHYRRYLADVALMNELGINAYRFSVSWSRVLPHGSGRVNEAGLGFYDRLVDSLLERGIAPSATLYHWDLPQALQDSGGWASRDTTERFRDYASVLFDRLGDRVRRWYTHNEPWVAAFAGHLQGRHAPGIADLSTAVAASHHLLLSHAMAVEAYRQSSASAGRELGAKREIGIVLNLYPCVSAGNSREDAEAASLSDAYQNRWFLDPLYRGEYPADLLARFTAGNAAPPVRDGDLSYIAAQKTDFLGVNYYFRKVVRAATADEIASKAVPHASLPIIETKPAGAPYTAIGWEVWPDGLRDLLVRLKSEYGNPRLLITENGAAFDDPAPVSDPEFGRIVNDEDRRAFLESHLSAAKDAIRDGCRLEGFYVWSLLDNFEWAQGYSKRFGIIRVDYATQERVWKKSGAWYRQFLKN